MVMPSRELKSGSSSQLNPYSKPYPPTSVQWLIGIPSVSAGLWAGSWCLHNSQSWPTVFFVRSLRNHQEQGYASLAFLGVTILLMLSGLFIVKLIRLLARNN
jgi:hypothetical protein